MEERGGMLVVAIILSLASNSLAKVSLYLSSDQTEALYGIKTDGLYYVREGVVNKYAMNFQHQVKTTLCICIFSRFGKSRYDGMFRRACNSQTIH